MKTLYFITGNKGKVQEAKIKFLDLNIDIVQKNLGYPEIQADRLEDVALYGAKDVQNNFDKPFILEDAGLFINYLDGFPGVYSAYAFNHIGCSGILKLLEYIDEKKRKATFRSVYLYSEPDLKPIIFLGECQGKISKKELGKNGFGYDPIFIPDKQIKTFAEMEIYEKNKYSHRGRSLEKLINFLKIKNRKF